MNNNISNNIADIALTAYKNMQNGKAININSLIKSAVVSLGFEILKNSLTGKKQKNTNAKKMFMIGGLIFLGLNSTRRI